jgi:hypothetical protein
MNTTAMPNGAQRAELVASWRDQARREEEAIDRLLRGLEKVRRLLLSETLAAIDEVQAVQSELESLPRELSGQRTRWQNGVASALGMPPGDVLVRTFAERIAGPERNEILADRARLARRAAQAADLGTSIRLLLRTRLDMLQRFFCDVTGVDNAPSRYGRAGRSVAPSYGSILERRG